MDRQRARFPLSRTLSTENPLLSLLKTRLMATTVPFSISPSLSLSQCSIHCLNNQSGRSQLLSCMRAGQRREGLKTAGSLFMSPDSRSAGRSVGDSGRRSLFPLVPVSLPARERVSAIKGAPRNNSILKLDDWTDTDSRQRLLAKKGSSRQQRLYNASTCTTG